MLVVMSLHANAGDVRDTGSIPRSGKSPRGETATHSSIVALENPHEQKNSSPWGETQLK